MHRRARHLTGRAAEAKLYFDARFISGASDGTAIQTWTDLSAAANNATQATVGKRPLYKVNIQGGCPMLLFDNVDDAFRTGTTTIGTAATMLGVCKLLSTSTQDSLLYIGNGVTYTPNYGQITFANYNSQWLLSNYSGTVTNLSGDVTATTDTNFNIHSCIFNDSSVNRLIKNGVQSGTNTYVTPNINSATLPVIGAWHDAGQWIWNGYIGLVAYWSVALSAPLRRRFEQAFSLSYKIACS